MKQTSLTPDEMRETFFTTLGRLGIAIKQADYSPEHKQRALDLFDKVSSEVNDVASELVEAHTRLTATDVITKKYE